VRFFIIPVVLILAAALVFTLWAMYHRGWSPRREIIKSKGRKALNAAARIERVGGPETIDFREPFWGHNITVELDADAVSHGHFWAQQKVYAGDYVLFLDRDHREHKYRFTWVQHTGNVDDMFAYEAIPVGGIYA
jgi:hypothetical protein